MRIQPLVAVIAAASICPCVLAGDAPPPLLQSLTVSNTVKTLQFSPAPAMDRYDVHSAQVLSGPFSNDLSGALNGFTFKVTNPLPAQFFSVSATPMSSNAVLSANVLNRLAYGPTPDELERLAAIGPQAYIDEQLAPESIVEDGDSWIAVSTNSVPSPSTPQWQFVSFRGRLGSATGTNLYLYLTGAGNVYIDDISLVTEDTNGVQSANLLLNAGFEDPAPPSGYPPQWRMGTAGNMSGSRVSTDYARSGSQSLHAVASSGGSSETTAISQRFAVPPGTVTSTPMILSFWYLPNAHSSKLLLRLSGNGVRGVGSPPPPPPRWIYATATGFGNTTGGPLYIYLNGSGECLIDDIKLVRGTVPEAGPNLLEGRNGDFENPISNWQLTADFANSYIETNYAFSGTGSLRVVATAAGGGGGDSIYQSVPGVTNNGVYTVSFWYLPPSRSRTLTVRLSGSRLVARPEESLASINRRLETIRSADYETGAVTRDSLGGAQLHDLRSWFVQNAVGSKRQLLEVLLQFLENHFVTQHEKSRDYFDRFYDEVTLMDILAADWEYREISKWRQALLNPDCTFHDLLKVHIESPAEIVYLDTVGSKGNGDNVANENYAREIMELFCMGVDNGYDQQDITVMSRAWTGWSVELVEAGNIDNPFAPASARVGFYPGNGTSGKSNLVGVWTFNYKAGNHGTNRAPIWSVWDPNSPATDPRPLGPKLVPARFGPPWAGTSYQLTIPRRVTGDTNSIQDGYDVARHIANLPFTMEYISIKLCRLFVHDEFPNPTTHSDAPEYSFYDYTRADLSAEAKLVRECMLAWWNSTPRGNMRAVLNTIFSSELFRSHRGSAQKVKTPLEFAASTIRALRSENPDGTFTARTDGYSISGRSRTASSAPLSRMGSMMLFDRDSPDGYPETGSAWISAGTLAERIRFVQTTLMATGDARKNDAISGGNLNLTDPVALLKKKLPASSWNNADAVAGYFVSILFPAEGQANLAQYRQLAVSFLNTNDAGAGTSLFSGLSHTGTAYDTRVRATVSMLMTLQRFQEQ